MKRTSNVQQEQYNTNKLSFNATPSASISMDFVVSVQEYKTKTTSSLDEQPIEWKIRTTASYSAF